MTEPTMRANDFLERLVLVLVVAVAAIAGACDPDHLPPPKGDPIIGYRCSFFGPDCPSGYGCTGSQIAMDGLGACRRVCVKGDTCPGGATCEALDPSCTEATCSYLCVPPACGGLGGLTCAEGLTCIDDGTDACEPASSGDCPGVCAG